MATIINKDRDDKIVMAVLRGEKQSTIAKRYNVTDGRVNQIFADWTRTKEPYSVKHGPKVKRT